MALKSLSTGFINIDAAGTIQRVTAAETDPTVAIRCHSIRFEARAGNAGLIYVGNSALVVATGVGLFAQLAIPTDNITPSFTVTLVQSPNGFNLADFYVDASVTNDDVLVTYLVL